MDSLRKIGSKSWAVLDAVGQQVSIDSNRYTLEQGH